MDLVNIDSTLCIHVQAVSRVIFGDKTHVFSDRNSPYEYFNVRWVLAS